MLRAGLIIATSLILLLILLRAFRNIDQLLEIEYQSYRHMWVKDGEPSGFFWKPPEYSGQGSSLARSRLSLVWVFQTPPWAQDDSEAINALKRLRFAFLAWNLGIIVWFLAMVPLG